MTVWNMTPEMTLAKSVGQCRHVMTRWPDELCAGTSFITYFGGSGDPCGNWSYLLDRVSPRPAAEPQVVADADAKIAVPVKVMNPFSSRTTFELAASPADWGTAQSVKVTLEPGEAATVELVYAVKSGGGSGKTTLFRPKRYSLGLKSGQLAKDSSVYRVDFRREGTKTIYDLRIPWSEIPGFTPAKGASFGCNLVLVDGDGKGAGRMVWGANLSDDTAGCGLVTLLP